jgi:2-amino-4-hydroxy-6-hydroxymethyldihydropteridine diphosphokinase / dihydropteroate synthase
MDSQQQRTACCGGGCGTSVSSPASKTRTAYVALGSNLGDRVAMIEQACKEMDSRGIKVKRTSSLWETEPMYVLDQDRFVNGACEVRPMPMPKPMPCVVSRGLR